jgi:chromosome segregation ATPase
MNKEDNKMPRETIASLKAKNAELETQNKKYYDAWLKLEQERQREVEATEQYKSLMKRYEQEQKASAAVKKMLISTQKKCDTQREELSKLRTKVEESTNQEYMQLKASYDELSAKYEETKELYDSTQPAYNAAVTAQNELQGNYERVCAELKEAQAKLSEVREETHNARNAGRKPKFTNEQMEQVRKMAADGLSVRKIAAEMSCSIGLVCKILHSNKN